MIGPDLTSLLKCRITDFSVRDLWEVTLKNLNIGLLILRVSMGFMMLYGHGLDKLSSFGEKSATFPAIFGMSPKIALSVAVLTEFFAALFVMLGLFTRISASLVAVTMAVAAFVVHSADPFAVKEKALLYLVGFVVIALLGPGSYSVESKKNLGW